MIKTIEIPPIEDISLEEEVQKLENISEPVNDPNFTFKYKTDENPPVTFKKGDSCRVAGKNESGTLQWDNRYIIEGFYVKIDTKEITLIEVKTKKDDGSYEIKRFPINEFLNIAFGVLGDDRKWNTAREYDPNRENGI